MNGLKVVFRADASLQIGSGHVMRCLTLADALRKQGAECHFICREHPGNLIDVIRERGFSVYILPSGNLLEYITKTCGDTHHWHWLGVSQERDAEQCSSLLDNLKPHWLIVDHYALDVTWELMLKRGGLRLFVIDDLADRKHVCDILLDQTFGRKIEDYDSLLPPSCIALCGSKYALLRPEFARLRSYSLSRRTDYSFNSILITLGGVDKDNVTRKILEQLKMTVLPYDCRIIVVMGATAPWLNDIQQFASTMPWFTEVRVNVNDMAQLMADSDFSVGAAGATSWERCCLGVPTAMLVLADNQKFAANLLVRAKAVELVDTESPAQLANVIDKAVRRPEFLKSLSEHSSSITDGAGCELVIRTITDVGAIDGYKDRGFR
ncbi:UDP-2,4-diacetamido-2,4,6-trideoxy-beta-L-altropyranose hydrolase [Pseudomonas sp. NFACC32-1]|uniref:UDP-2,4-diacetamido-2,4, 6-trideoxy-beta-L-altropyranose hydrolase n=1 Tax=unclassified Pseudomonas TaxID=196821 RepID=UPI0008760AA7|nr:UDP-2,4-diacetamido-2,4,6-trideoxy-beta-L-altropyranose hydrolase [Pseudomonas sp. 7SR1]SCX40694.1 UDP-2,4-diacetamido-2,4,6-trideoxy-beta-L-altropyranose hydrolase [Pseudomonas sp. NFACC32-1]SFX06063.1 UDP-2,4-diacetamido-2,4,6-trideoxy-beta-L-altropyranose hydrolase [Pseudomonas sp. NFACC49-2]SFX20913.1 UDP-2,4-diacetamido-2,4,6-trideoxy-beta-L-altropyranose hydrolase [Pseudomonas sp. NFACC36]SIS27227.1 UDP-2,4-diacetamido-2,4,6-trideoxy-beta-L-altropyranose hydrolase [Pseudomonas sp. 7SR1